MNDVRISTLLMHKCAEPNVEIIPFCVDEGVARNGGRVGAASAPQKILEAFGKLTPNPARFDKMVDVLHKTIVSEPIFMEGADLESAQISLGEKVQESLEKNRFPIILGGGHETSFGHFLGYVFAQNSIDAINVDAHADVRELKNGKAHSGSPFRQMLEHESEMLEHYSVFGLGKHCVAKEHFDYLRAKNCDFHWIDETRRADATQLSANRHHPFFLSIDADAIDQAFMPAVSAPNADGLSPQWVYNFVKAAGRNPNCHSFDLVEINPNYDVGDAGIKVAALILWNLFSGLSTRFW